MAFIDVDPVAAALVQACFIPGEVGIVQCRCSHKLDDLLNKEEEHRAQRPTLHVESGTLQTTSTSSHSLQST